MSTYRKEKNLIIISLDGVNGEYKLDINTGLYYGLRGNPVKTINRRNEIYRMFWNGRRSTNLEYILHHLFGSSGSITTSRWLGLARIADKLDAVGVPSHCWDSDQFAYLEANIREVSAWLKAHSEEIFDYRQFKRENEFAKAKKVYGSLLDNVDAEMFDTLYNNLPNITKEELDACLYYLVRGKYAEYCEYISRNWHTLYDYIRMCRVMDKKPEKVNNFMREYCETKRTYELKKREYDDNRMRKNYEAKAKAWEFEFGDYRIVLPSITMDIVDEGKNMHHCVGSYVDRVVNGDTFIVFVRRKDTPDKCYITCQVHTSGEIGQYYLAYDRYISSADDRAFKEAFQAHLHRVWNEGGQQ